MAVYEHLQQLYSNVMDTYNKREEKPIECDEQDYEAQSLLLAHYPALRYFKHPCRILIIGKSGSGKTSLAAAILAYMAPEIDFIYLCSPTVHLQNTWDGVSHLICRYFDDIEEALMTLKEKTGDGYNYMLWIDDLSFERMLNQGSKGILSEFAYNLVHMSVTIGIICHRLTSVGTSFRDSIEHVICFNVTNQKEKKAMAEEFSITGNTKEFMLVYNEIVKKPLNNGSNSHPFLYINYVDGEHVFNGFKEELQIINARQ